MILLENLAKTLRVLKHKSVYLSQFVAGIEETPVLTLRFCMEFYSAIL
jgi:hypothetical protein